MLPALSENKYDPEREIFTHYPVYHHEQPMSAIRKGDWKLVENLVSGEFDLLCQPNGCISELYSTFAPSIVPVPAAVWLFGSALLGFIGIARKRKIA